MLRRLLVIYSPGGNCEGRARLLTGEESFELGRRGAQLGLAASDASLSRVHCAIRGNEVDGYRVEDLGSSNGTWVNGKRVKEHCLRESDLVRLGDHLLLYQCMSSLEAVAMLSGESEPSQMIGPSPHLSLLRSRVRAIGVHSAPVIILVETGTGKDVVASVLHSAFSGSKDKLFVPLNSGALVESLAESTLFGHKRGAFSGADTDRPGAFREAQGGTLFLDELGDMPLAIQVKMLRVLESGEVRPVGADATIQVDARLIAATNRDLGEALDSGHFRSDLFNRLSVHVLRLSALRERRDDILPLFRHFLRTYLKAPAPPITPRAAELLTCHHWHESNARGVRTLAQAIATSRKAAPEESSAAIVGPLLDDVLPPGAA